MCFIKKQTETAHNLQTPILLHGNCKPALSLQVVAERNLQPHPNWLNKCIQLYETSLVRHGIMLVGPSGAGKTAIIECLAAALTETGQKTVIWRMNPKVRQRFSEAMSGPSWLQCHRCHVLEASFPGDFSLSGRFMSMLQAQKSISMFLQSAACIPCILPQGVVAKSKSSGQHHVRQAEGVVHVPDSRGHSCIWT